MSLRKKERLADAIKAEVSRIILFDMTDPRLGFITVTGVELSSDLRTATVKLSVMGDEKVQTVTINAIQHARGYIQKQLMGKILTRWIPDIRFELDESVKRSVRISQALRKLSEEQ
jgi:ribosome-binding factor A